MKKQRLKTILLGVSGVFFSISLAFLAFPYKSNANSVNQQFVSTRCLGPSGSFSCNDCTSGSNVCWDHTCAECNPGGGPIQ